VQVCYEHSLSLADVCRVLLRIHETDWLKGRLVLYSLLTISCAMALKIQFFLISCKYDLNIAVLCFKPFACLPKQFTSWSPFSMSDSYLTLLAPLSPGIFSSLSSIHVLWYQLGEFAQTSSYFMTCMYVTCVFDQVGIL